MEGPLNHALGGLWAYTIDTFTYDPRRQTLTLVLSEVDGGKFSTATLAFERVTHYAYVYANYPSMPDLPRFPPAFEEIELGDHAELSAIEYYREDMGTIRYVPRTAAAPAISWSSNFVAAVWGGRLFIRAAQVQIDGVRHEVDYP